MTHHISPRRIWLGLLFLTALAAPPVGAQRTQRDSVTEKWTDPAIATLMLVDSLPHPDARAIVIRRGGDGPGNIILVTSSTRPADLSKAVTALIFSRRSKGDQVEREMRTIISASTASAATPAKRSSTRDHRRAELDLRRLRLAPPFEIAGVGRGPALVVRMADGATKQSPTTSAKKPGGR